MLNLVVVSKLLCVTISLVSSMLWMLGYQKGRNYTFISLGIYSIIRIVVEVISHV